MPVDPGIEILQGRDDWWTEDAVTRQLREVGEPKGRFIRLTDDEARSYLDRFVGKNATEARGK